MSTRRKPNWPSFGFLLILGSLSLLAVLIVWGWQQPVLDQAFAILARRELVNDPEFSQKEVALLQKVWDKHPGFARALVGKGSARFLEPTVAGWFQRRKGHLSLRPETERPAQFTLEARGEHSDFPIVVKLTSAGFLRQIEFTANESRNIEISTSEIKRPRILDVEVVSAQGQAANAPTFGLRLITGGAAPLRDLP